MNTKALEDIGLNKSESEVYLALQELGEAKTGVICKKLDIPNSHIYSILNSLIQKGLVSYKYSNKVKVFKPLDPEILKSLFKEKQEQLKVQEEGLINLIQNLKKLPKNKETDSDYQYYEGIKAIKNMILQIYSNTPIHSEMLLLSAKSDAWEQINAYYLEMHKIRVAREIALKMIMQKQTTELKKRIQERKKIGLVDIRISDFNNDSEILVTDNYLVILDTSTKTKTPCAFMIQNKIFIAMFKELYLFIWNNCKS